MWIFNCYVDASHASDIDTRRSITGYIFFISGGPVSWQSRMQTSVALSSMEAEYMAASAATQEALWQARLLLQLGMRVDLPITLYEDNKSAIMFADHPGDHRTTKHIDTKINFAREAQTNGFIKLVYVPTAEQLADGMTNQAHYFNQSVSIIISTDLSLNLTVYIFNVRRTFVYTKLNFILLISE